MPDLVEEYGWDDTNKMMWEAMKEIMPEFPRDVFDRVIRFEKARSALNKRWKDTQGFTETYIISALWSRLTPEKQLEVLEILEKEAAYETPTT